MRQDRLRVDQYQDPPVGVSWLDYPTLPIEFQTGHPDRRVLVFGDELVSFLDIRFLSSTS